MRNPRPLPRGQRPSVVQVLWMIFGIVAAIMYFTRKVLVSLYAGGWATDLDAPAYQWVLNNQSPVLFAISDFLYFWGSTPGMSIIMVLITGLLSWKTRSFWPFIAVALTAVVSVGLTILLKASLQVHRPEGIPGGPTPPLSYSFPSGHTLNSAALIGISSYLAIIYGLRRYAYVISTVATLFVLAMGASRIYIGHHWVSDVLVGLLIGAAWAAVVAILHYFFVPRNKLPNSARGSVNR